MIGKLSTLMGKRIYIGVGVGVGVGGRSSTGEDAKPEREKWREMGGDREIER